MLAHTQNLAFMYCYSAANYLIYFSLYT